MFSCLFPLAPLDFLDCLKIFPLIQDPSGYPIGAFELAHHEPSDLDSSEQAKLTELTKIVEEQIALDYGSK